MFDNLSKFLAQQYSQDFASWLIGKPIKLTELKPTELSLEPIRADSVILLKSKSLIVHCEFQTDPDPDMGFRMADYALRIYRKFPKRRLVQVVVYLRQTTSQTVHVTTFEANHLSHQFRVIRLWEQPTDDFFQHPGLLPYAALSQTTDRAAVLRRVAHAIESLPDRQQRSDLSAASAVIAGLSLDVDTIRRILRREMMQESVIYQEWQAESKQQGRQEGARSLVILLLNQKFGAISSGYPQGGVPSLTERIASLSLEQLEALAIALLNFSVIADLESWLDANG